MVCIYNHLKSQGILPPIIFVTGKKDYGAEITMQPVLIITDANVILVSYRTLSLPGLDVKFLKLRVHPYC